METVTTSNVIQSLINFVDQRPGITPSDYISGYNDINGRRCYYKEVKEVAKDRADFYSLLEVAERLIHRDELIQSLYNRLKNESGRLLLVNDRLTYHTGQYFPTEFRVAACQLIKSVLWEYFYKVICANVNPPITADLIRKYAKRYFSRRVYNNYFA